MAEPIGQTQATQLIYRPPPRWYFWTALGAALAIHLTAVAVSQRHEAPAVDLPPQPLQVVEAVLAPPEATPPPEDIPIPEPPPPPDIQPEFVEERTPPPRQPNAAKFTPIKAPGPMSMSRAKALALYAPKPQYPYEARSRHVTGSGVIVARWTQLAGTSLALPSRQAPGVRYWIMPPLARFGSGDLDLEQFPRLTFPSHSP